MTTTATNQNACPDCGFGWNAFTFGAHYDTCRANRCLHNRIASECVFCDPIGLSAPAIPKHLRDSLDARLPTVRVKTTEQHWEWQHTTLLAPDRRVVLAAISIKVEDATHILDALDSIDSLRERERVLTDALRSMLKDVETYQANPYGHAPVNCIGKAHAALALIDDGKAKETR